MLHLLPERDLPSSPPHWSRRQILTLQPGHRLCCQVTFSSSAIYYQREEGGSQSNQEQLVVFIAYMTELKTLIGLSCLSIIFICQLD